MNSRRLYVFRDPNSRRGRLALYDDTDRKNEPTKGEESERMLRVLIAKAQNSIEASRALISKIDTILRRGHVNDRR
jgi:hypothetical protein